MNPILAATLRRHWPLVGAVGLFSVFFLVDQVIFQPAARRYDRAVKQATELGLALDPAQSTELMPPRVFALVADNALLSTEAQELGDSGVLTARLLEDMTRLIGDNGMEVLATEPGAVTQQSRSVTVNAHLRVRGRYPQFVTLLEQIAQGGNLIAVDRFTFSNPAPGDEQIDLWISRLVLKQEPRRK